MRRDHSLGRLTILGSREVSQLFCPLQMSSTTGLSWQVLLSSSLSSMGFFEGIPTLSQCGLALTVPLMLGIGIVGFRRFV